MKQLSVIFCIASTIVLAACVETTSTQREYSDYRDECREYAELKMGSGVEGAAPNDAYKKRLLKTFRDCMKRKGWSVTAPGQEKASNTPPPLDGSPAGEVSAAVAPIQPVEPTAAEVDTKRAAECAYARHAALHSSNARALAKACDLECKNKRKLAPDMPAPAACAE